MVSVDTIRRGYVDAAHGQLHYRTLGDGAPLLLLHWAPSNGRMLEPVMPAFADAGYRVLAFDVPGYGQSHKLAAGWSLAQCATELAAGLDALGVEACAVVGGHFSAPIAAELAIAAPRRFPRIVLDGSPTLTPAEMAELMRAFAGLSPAWTAQGGHKAFLWDMTERFLHEWDPRYVANDASMATHYAYMGDYLEMDFETIRAFIEPGSRPRGGLATYDATARWPLIPVPTLALTADREALRAAHVRAVSLLRDTQEHCFPGSHPLFDAARAQEYAAVITAFLGTAD